MSIDTIRAAPGIDPEAIIDVARTLRENPHDWSRRLAWNGRPSYEELLATCSLVFQLSGGRRRGGVSSELQLARRVDLVRQHSGQIRPLAEEQMRFSGAEADEAVEDVLDFIREWPSHQFPRLLMVLQAITEDVFARYKLPVGDYKHYAGVVEALFRPPMLTTLEEYGLPAPLAVGCRISSRLTRQPARSTRSSTSFAACPESPA